MNILFVTPEVYPFARAGGLGDVSHFLPSALADRGHHIWVITPKHRTSSAAGYPLEKSDKVVTVPLSWRSKSAEIFTARVSDQVDVILVGCDDLYHRDGLYGNEYGDYEDNAERFIFFSRAVPEFALALGLKPDLVHCHDWPCGLVPIYLKTLYSRAPAFQNTASVFTYHNLGSQGVFWHYDYAMTGLGWEHFTPEGLEFHGQFNMTKAGLVAGDLISTVSRRYAEETLTSEFAFGLEGVIRMRRSDLHAVLNGVDYAVWDPAIDTYLAANYSPENLQGKSACRAELTDLFELNQDAQPIVAVISRLLDRKGFDIISAAADRLMSQKIKIVFMGRGEDRYQIFLENLTKAYPGRIGVSLDYDKKLSHQIMAGADIFLMPSRFEPCGLEQLYGLKYGAVPIVRATGGLDDTVTDVVKHPERGTGFKFVEYSADAMLRSVVAAVDLFNDRSQWSGIMRRGMAGDFSWKKSAEEYETIYQKALLKVRKA